MLTDVVNAAVTMRILENFMVKIKERWVSKDITLELRKMNVEKLKTRKYEKLQVHVVERTLRELPA